MPVSCFADVIRQRLHHQPGRPLVTFYDDATGERTELSTTSWANWVAKSAGVLVDDLMLEPGDRVRLDLPTHWLGPVFLGAVWLAGLQLTDDPDTDLVVTTPDRASDRAASGRSVLVTGLGPFAARVPALGPGIEDFGTLWPGQPDAFLGLPGGPEDQATDAWTQRELLDRLDGETTGVSGYDDADRVLSDLNPCTPAGIDLFVGTLIRSSPTGGASVVWLASDPPRSSQRWSDLTRSELTTREVRDFPGDSGSSPGILPQGSDGFPS